jgi:hypothetical protein
MANPYERAGADAETGAKAGAEVELVKADSPF